jgi:iron complex outermembrane receptor protein
MKSFKTNPHAFRALVAATAVAAASPALVRAAGADPRHEETQLETIEVTAAPLRGTAEELTRPAAVLAGEALDEARAATLGETVDGIPGIQSSNFGPGVGRPIIRGLDGARVAVLAGGLDTQDVSTVSQDHAPVIEPFLADQIEVLKGPSTLFYGSGAIGGIVNVVDGRIPEAPRDEVFSGRAEARYETVNTGHSEMFRIDGSGATFGLHADAVHRDLDDYDRPDGPQPNSFLETDTGALGGSWYGDWGFFGVSASRYENTYGNPGEPGDPAEGEASVFLDIEQDRIEAKGALLAPFGGLDSIRFAAARTDYEHIEFEGDEIGTQFLKDASEARLELAHAPWAGWSGAVGVQYNDSDFEAIGEEAFVPRTASRATGLFLVERRTWGTFQLDLGARVDDVSRDPDDGAERSFDPLSLSAGAIWRLHDDWHVVASLDHAERAPVEEELFSNGPHVATAAFEIGDPNLTEEAANQVELGVHYHSDSVQGQVSAYYNRFDDFIFLVDTGTIEDDLPVRQWTQADARFRGLEAEATFKLADSAEGRWELHLLADTVRATLSGGGNLPRIAPSRLGGQLRWSRDQWRASVGAMRYAEQDDVAEGETPTDGYTLVDAHVAYHWDAGGIGWELFVDGHNLTDQVRQVHTSFLKDVVVLPGRGASFGIRAFF